MRKTAYTVPALVFLMGIVGFILRRRELATAFEEGTGFLKRGETSVYLVIGLTAIAAVFVILFAWMALKGRASDVRYEKAFAMRSFFGLFLYTLLGLSMLGAAALYFVESKEAGTHTMVPELVFSAFAALSGIAVVIMASTSFKGKGNMKGSFFSIIPPLFLCFWLILLYKENASNPILLEFCYRCLALAASALAFYYSAGYAYGRARPKMTVITSLLAVYLSVLSMADDMRLSQLILFGALAAVQLLNSSYFIKNLKKV